MSVTFGCPDAPVVEMPCEWCAPSDDGTGRCSPFCTGVVQISTAPTPEVNYANGNAAALLDLLGFDATDLFGQVLAAELPDFRRRLIRALNTDRCHLVRQAHVLEAGHSRAMVVEDGTGVIHIEGRGCRVVFAGNTDEQTLRRLHALLSLVVWAQDRELAVTWS